MRSSAIIVSVIIIGFISYRFWMKNKTKESQLALNNNSNRTNKDQIISNLKEMRNKHLEDFINYEMTLLYRTELEDQEVKNKLIKIYPKTYSTKPLNFSPLFQKYDAELVDSCILELLESLGAEHFEEKRNEPFLRFEYYIKQEGKASARILFDDFVKQN